VVRRADVDDPQLPLHDVMQQRYELIRPLVLLQDRTARQRAQETDTHPETVGALKRRFEAQGMLGLLPDTLQVIPVGRRRRVPDEVVEELQRLKGLSDGFGYRELARILFHTGARRVSHHSINKLWHQLAPATPRQLPLLDSHTYPTRAEARREVITLYAPGWSKRSISRFLHVSRPTITAWITRFEADNAASLEDKSRAPPSPVRKVWLPVMVEIYHRQKRHPDAGGFRIWSLRGKTDLSGRTIERILASNRQVYADISPGGRTPPRKTTPGLHPFQASVAHEYWFIDGRIMDLTLEGAKWWSLIVLDGYSRTMLAGAVAPTEASWVALMVLYTACLRYGAPTHLISDKGGAYISDDVEAVCTRLGIDHRTITSTQGESDKNLMETHFNIPRRLYDYQFSLTRTPPEFEQAHQDFLQLYNTTAHQGLLREQFQPPIPLAVLGEAKGRVWTPDDLARTFARALFPRTTNRYGWVTLHSYHVYVEAGLPQTQVLLWVSGNTLRAVFNTVGLAEYHCHYHLREGKVTDIREGSFPPTRFASSQGTLLPLNPHAALVLYRPKAAMHQARLPLSAQQLWLFERCHSA
jgi:transposase